MAALTCENLVQAGGAAEPRREREMTATNASNTDWTTLQQAEDVAYFRADLCLYSPESYSLKEKRGVSL
ncbi:MAG: hypothetical protein J6D34_07355 [Atopobiaceae bacterium]|nr:hypothetical protein [Atopobiaceae bacterium]